MNELQATCLVASLLFYASDLHAQEVVAVPPGIDKIVPMKKGEAAQFDGALFDNSTALRWANWLMQYKHLVASDQELQKKLCAADMELLQKKLSLEEKQYEQVTAELQEKLKKAQEEAANPPFYRTTWFGVTLGVVGTIAIVAGSAAFVNAVK